MWVLQQEVSNSFPRSLLQSVTTSSPWREHQVAPNNSKATLPNWALSSLSLPLLLHDGSINSGCLTLEKPKSMCDSRTTTTTKQGRWLSEGSILRQVSPHTQQRKKRPNSNWKPNRWLPRARDWMGYRSPALMERKRPSLSSREDETDVTSKRKSLKSFKSPSYVLLLRNVVGGEPIKRRGGKRKKRKKKRRERQMQSTSYPTGYVQTLPLSQRRRRPSPFLGSP